VSGHIWPQRAVILIFEEVWCTYDAPHNLGPRVAAKTNARRKTEKSYEEEVAFFDKIVRDAFQSIRSERLSRKALAHRVGLTEDMLRNMERGHRKMGVGDLMVLSVAMRKIPNRVLEEIQRRFAEEIEKWLVESGYQ
jgi:hypothetical protein